LSTSYDQLAQEQVFAYEIEQQQCEVLIIGEAFEQDFFDLCHLALFY
jgi:hypothetical protein